MNYLLKYEANEQVCLAIDTQNVSELHPETHLEHLLKMFVWLLDNYLSGGNSSTHQPYGEIFTSQTSTMHQARLFA